MSLRAMLWAFDDAPVEDAVAALILLGLADEANDDGTDACPYKDKLIERARKSERTVQTHLRNLYQARLIEFGDQTVAMRRYGKQAGHAPRAWNLNMQYTKANVPEARSEEEMRLYARFMATGRVDDDPVDNAGSAGVQKLHPTPDQGKQKPAGVQNLHPTQTGSAGVQKLHPTPDQGKQSYPQAGGVQPTAPFPIGSKTKRKPLGFRASSDDDAAGSSEAGPETPEKIFPSTKNQEESLALVDDVGFFPQLDAAEQQLFDECQLLGDDRWNVRVLRKVLGTPLIRALRAENPELVVKAFRIGARDEATTTPRRMLWLDKCPHWDRARTELEMAGERRTSVIRQRHAEACQCGGSGWVEASDRPGVVSCPAAEQPVSVAS